MVKRDIQNIGNIYPDKNIGVELIDLKEASRLCGYTQHHLGLLCRQEKLKAKIRDTLVTMHQEPEGRRILEELMIERFVAPREIWYESIRNIKQKVRAAENKVDASQDS